MALRNKSRSKNRRTRSDALPTFPTVSSRTRLTISPPQVSDSCTDLGLVRVGLLWVYPPFLDDWKSLFDAAVKIHHPLELVDAARVKNLSLKWQVQIQYEDLGKGKSKLMFFSTHPYPAAVALSAGPGDDVGTNAIYLRIDLRASYKEITQEIDRLLVERYHMKTSTPRRPYSAWKKVMTEFMKAQSHHRTGLDRISARTVPPLGSTTYTHYNAAKASASKQHRELIDLLCLPDHT